MLTFFCVPAQLLQDSDNLKSSDAQKIVWRLVGAVLGFWDSGIMMQIFDMILDMNPYRLYTLKIH